MLKANKVLISWQDVVFIKWVLLKCQLQRFVYLLSFLSQGLRIHVFNILFSRNKEEQKEEDGLTWDHHNSNSESKWLHLREQGFSVGTRDTLDMWFLKIKKEMWSKRWEENSNERLTRKEEREWNRMKPEMSYIDRLVKSQVKRDNILVMNLLQKQEIQVRRLQIRRLKLQKTA